MSTQDDSENNQILLGIAGLCTTWMTEDYVLKNCRKIWTEYETERIWGKKQMNEWAYRMFNFTGIWNSIATYAPVINTCIISSVLVIMCESLQCQFALSLQSDNEFKGKLTANSYWVIPKVSYLVQGGVRIYIRASLAWSHTLNNYSLMTEFL